MHYSFDAVMLSTLLAAIRRSTGIRCVNLIIDENPLQSSIITRPFRIFIPSILLQELELKLSNDIQSKNGIREQRCQIDPHKLSRVSSRLFVRKSYGCKSKQCNLFVKISVGEWMFDASVMILSRSSWFERKR